MTEPAGAARPPIGGARRRRLFRGVLPGWLAMAVWPTLPLLPVLSVLLAWELGAL